MNLTETPISTSKLHPTLQQLGYTFDVKGRMIVQYYNADGTTSKLNHTLLLSKTKAIIAQYEYIHNEIKWEWEDKGSNLSKVKLDFFIDHKFKVIEGDLQYFDAIVKQYKSVTNKEDEEKCHYSSINVDGKKIVITSAFRIRQYLERLQLIVKALKTKNPLVELPDIPYQSLRKLDDEVVDGNKYSLPKGERVRPSFSGSHNPRIDTVIILEGDKKARHLNWYFKKYHPKCRFRFIHIDGILSFSIEKHQQIIDYVYQNNIKNIITLYDADFDQLSKDAASYKRPRNFHISMKNACESFFRTFGKKPSQNFYLAHHLGNKNEKGIDDLFTNKNSKEQILNLIEELVSFDNNKVEKESFIFKQVYKTTIRKRINEVFEYSDVEEYFQKYRSQLPTEFEFENNSYYLNDNGTLSMKEVHSYDVNVIQSIKIHKYIDKNAQGKVFKAIKEHRILQLEAPTGSGKTTLAKKLKYSKIIAVPTIAIANQLYSDLTAMIEKDGSKEKIGLFCSSDKRGFEKQEDRVLSKTIICTFDSLRHIPIEEIKERLLIVDESHILVDAASYRMKAVAYLMDCVQYLSKKALLMSATPNLLFCETYKLPMLRLLAPRKRHLLSKIEVLKDDKSYYNYAVVNQINESADKVTIVYYNDKGALLTIKKELIAKGFKADEIVTITSSADIDEADKKELIHIQKNERISENTRVVLATCKIREGVNIKNENVGEVFLVGDIPVTDYIQFTARFRNIDLLHVVCIRPKKNYNAEDFSEGFEAMRIRLQASKRESTAINNQLNLSLFRNAEILYFKEKARFDYTYCRLRSAIFLEETEICTNAIELSNKLDQERIDYRSKLNQLNKSETIALESSFYDNDSVDRIEASFKIKRNRLEQNHNQRLIAIEKQRAYEVMTGDIFVPSTLRILHNESKRLNDYSNLYFYSRINDLFEITELTDMHSMDEDSVSRKEFFKEQAEIEANAVDRVIEKLLNTNDLEKIEEEIEKGDLMFSKVRKIIKAARLMDVLDLSLDATITQEDEENSILTMSDKSRTILLKRMLIEKYQSDPSFESDNEKILKFYEVKKLLKVKDLIDLNIKENEKQYRKSFVTEEKLRELFMLSNLNYRSGNIKSILHLFYDDFERVEHIYKNKEKKINERTIQYIF